MERAYKSKSIDQIELKTHKPKRFDIQISRFRFCLAFIVGLLMLILVAASFASEEGIEATEARIRDTIAFMASRGSRIAGYPGCEEAADFVERAFREIGLDDVVREEYSVVVPMDNGATLTIPEEGTAFALQCLWPNLVKTSTLPEEAAKRAVDTPLRGPQSRARRKRPRLP